MVMDCLFQKIIINSMTIQTATRKRTGRPRAFSEDEALEAAMRVFWEKGYEGATLADLTAAMGINRSSLYTIFGDKETLFGRAIQRYTEGPAAYVRKAIQEPTAHAVVEALLKGSASMLSNPQNPRGCLSVQGALACGSDSQGARLSMVDWRKEGEAVLEARFERAKESSELPQDMSAGDLARYVATLITGLGVQAANGASKEEMNSIVALALTALPF